MWCVLEQKQSGAYMLQNGLFVLLTPELLIQRNMRPLNSNNPPNTNEAHNDYLLPPNLNKAPNANKAPKASILPIKRAVDDLGTNEDERNLKRIRLINEYIDDKKKTEWHTAHMRKIDCKAATNVIQRMSKVLLWQSQVRLIPYNEWRQFVRQVLNDAKATEMFKQELLANPMTDPVEVWREFVQTRCTEMEPESKETIYLGQERQICLTEMLSYLIVRGTMENYMMNKLRLTGDLDVAQEDAKCEEDVDNLNILQLNLKTLKLLNSIKHKKFFCRISHEMHAVFATVYPGPSFFDEQELCPQWTCARAVKRLIIGKLQDIQQNKDIFDAVSLFYAFKVCHIPTC